MSTLATPVRILQDLGEFRRLLKLYRARRPHRVLEVGTYDGGTLYHWITSAAPGAVIVAIDWQHPNHERYAEWSDGDVTVHAIVGNSHHPKTVEQAAEHAPFDFIFIDADHEYEAVRADWLAYRPLAAPGGIVAFHDIAGDVPEHPEIQVRQLWAEIKAEGYEVEEIVERGDWQGIGIVHLEASP